MEVIGAIASFIAIGQALAVTPKIITALRSVAGATEELASLIDELESLNELYEQLKEHIEVFSGDQTPSLLRVDRPPFLKHVHEKLESLIVELQELAASCRADRSNSLKASKIRWLKRRGHVARLRDKCEKQQQSLLWFYYLFKEQYSFKQGHALVQILSNTSQANESVPPASLPLSENELKTAEHVRDDTAARRSTSSQDLVVTAEGSAGLECRCPCHVTKKRRRSYYNLQIPFFGTGFFSYRLQRVKDHSCKMQCCDATRSFAVLQFRVPIWLCNSFVIGTVRAGPPLRIATSLDTTTRYSSNVNLLFRACHFGEPQYFNRILSHLSASPTSIDKYGNSILEVGYKSFISILFMYVDTYLTLAIASHKIQGNFTGGVLRHGLARPDKRDGAGNVSSSYVFTFTKKLLI
ncbi:hypothetical protein F4808DRAFT_75280 [Astrocystis sublimbata]|nr:hypothetical protein F4808DRAFT_75280 [Astrocystis sublimbata]